MARALPLLVAVCALAAPASAGADLGGTLERDLNASGRASGAYVLDLTGHEVLFARRANTPRVMMSNTKLFTTGAALAALGPRKRFETGVFGINPIRPDGVLAGDLYLHGGGDPTFGDAAAARLAAALKGAGLRRVAGDVVGDGSLFDSELGPPAWQLNDTPPGPVGALQFNRGISGTNAGSPVFVADPAAFAAAGVRTALLAAGVAVEGGARAGRVPRVSVRLESVKSPTLATLVRLTNKPSDNLFAETIAKLLGRRTSGHGTRRAGVKAALRFGRSLGVKVDIKTGSGAFPFPHATPRQLVRFLAALRKQQTFPALRASLPIAGRDGTLADRLTAPPARGGCRAKTGSHFSPVQPEQASVLSGYCSTRSGHLVVFSIMMNAMPDVEAARALQDHMVQAIAGLRR